MRNNIEAIKPILASPKKIFITTHARPDADALGSSLGLKLFLEALGHTVSVVVPTSYPDFIDWMPDTKDVIVFDPENPQPVEKLIANCNLLVCTDFSRLDRVFDLEPYLRKHTGDFLLIDHHLDPEEFAQYELWDPKASSACELVVRMMQSLGYDELITIDIAACLYTGIMTDTGSFRFPSTSPAVHRTLARLLETGLDHSKIHRTINENNRESRLRILGHALSQKLVILPEYRTAFVSLTAKELEQFNYKQGDTEGIVNFVLSLEGIIFAGIFMDKDEMIKISFRSVGDFSVANFSNQHFSGGGHKNAAGGKGDGTLDEVLEKFQSLLPQYKDGLLNSNDDE